MRMFSTKIKTLFSLALAFCAFQLTAQSPNTMTISSPASLAGDYQIVTAGFGDTEPSSTVSGTLALGVDGTAPENDACETVTNDLSGLIGMIDRGSCNFDLKVLNTQNAGAIAVLVCNSAPGDPIVMGAGDPPTNAEMVNVYAAMASIDLCDQIKMEIANGAAVDVSFSFEVLPCEVEYDETVVWGPDGQGTFSAGLGDWVTIGQSGEESIFSHTVGGTPDGAIWGPGNINIDSPSLCDGAAIIDFDRLSTGGTDEGLENNNPPFEHTSQLISPTIDLSDVDFPVLEFYQLSMPLNGNNFFAYSTDDGQTWTEERLIPTDNVFNASFQNVVGTEMLQFTMQEAANSPTVRLRFTASQGDYYFWMIDDVVIKDVRIADIRANQTFYAVAPNFQTPASQVDGIPFLIDIENIGNAEITNVAVEATVTNNTTGEVAHTQTLEYGDIPFDSLDENRFFPTTWTPPAEVASYTGNYNLISDNDENPNNNSHSYDFEITDNTFAKVQSEAEAGGEYLGARSTPNQFYESYGNHYYVPNGEGLFLGPVNFGVEIEDLANSFGFITVEFYQWFNTNTEDAAFSQADPGERVLLGSAEDIVITDDLTAAQLRNITVNLVNDDGGPIELTNDAHYLIMAHMRPASTSGSQYRIIAAETTSLRNFYYVATQLASETGFAEQRFGTMFGVGSTADLDDVENRTFSFNGAWTAYMPMRVGLYSDVDEVNNDLNVKIFPNPASDRLIVDLILDNNSEVVSFNLTNIDGKVLMTEKAYNIKNDKVELNISQVPSGVYMLNVLTEDGFINKKVVVSK